MSGKSARAHTHSHTPTHPPAHKRINAQTNRTTKMKKKTKIETFHITRRDTLLAVPDGNPQQCWFITKTWRGKKLWPVETVLLSPFFHPHLSTHSTHPLSYLPRHLQTLGRDVWRTATAEQCGRRQNHFGALNPAHLYNSILYIYINPKAQLYTLIMPDSLPPTHRAAILPLSFPSLHTKVATLFPPRKWLIRPVLH